MRMLTGVALAALILSPVSAVAADQTWTGKLVDTKCYSMNKKNVGNDHMTPKGKMANCASACAQMGIPAALLVDGKAYPLAAPAPALADYMAKDATVTGTLAGNIIVPTKVTVGGKDVNISGMM